jgi:DUF1680 family protein
MTPTSSITRRKFLASASATAAGAAGAVLWSPSLRGQAPTVLQPLVEFNYSEVLISSEPHEKQLRETRTVLMELDEDSLLKPMRQMAGQPAPGADLGGWYTFDPNYDQHPGNIGFATASTFGQWVSALSRMYAISPSPEIREKVLRLNRMYAQTISGNFYTKNRFPAYCYDKLVCGLIDSYQFAGDPDAFAILDRTTDAALPHLPKTAIERGVSWRPGTPDYYTWDESYTVPENLFLAYQRGAAKRFRELGVQYLDNQYYDPLAEDHNNLAGRHAYSHVNSLCSAMQAYLTIGSEKYLHAARNGFDMVMAQSFATGGWGPDEELRAADSGAVGASLTKTHHSFETPCGSYAHSKLTRYLLRVTRDPRYGDSMERMMYNTILGAKPLMPDGRTFYYADYNFAGKKVYSDHRWPCCSGTMPQVAADYRINAYFREPEGVYVNLYIPSTARWVQNGSQVSLTQNSAYPYDSLIKLETKLSKPAEFTMNLRIPAWAQDPEIRINGQSLWTSVVPGTFAAIHREWKTGDRIEVNLPLRMRLEPVDPQHLNTVALLAGPLVLFPITEKAPVISRSQLLSAKKRSAREWEAETASGSITLRPFTAIELESYTTYLNV